MYVCVCSGVLVTVIKAMVQTLRILTMSQLLYGSHWWDSRSIGQLCSLFCRALKQHVPSLRLTYR